MKMRTLHRTVQSILQVIFLSVFLLAHEVQAAQENEKCPSLGSYSAVLQCVLIKHPEIQRAANFVNQSSLEENVARQIPNPELDSKAVFGNVSGASTHETEIAILHTFELGGKRGARVRKAEAELESAKAESQKTTADAYITTVLRLHRLRQLDQERQIVQESLSAFSAALKNFSSRPRLGPEQSVSSDIIQLAKADYEIKRSSFDTEAAEIKKLIELAVDEKINWQAPLLPQAITTWPKIPAASEPTGWKGSEFRFAQANLHLAQSELDVAQGEAWPNLRFGPAYKSQSDGQNSYSQFGLSLSLPLPLYQRNGAGKAYAEQGISRAVANTFLIQRELTSEREIQFKKYEASIGVLSQSIDTKAIEKKRKNAEGLFARGLISGQLVIEAERQALELTRSQHEQEASALQALLRIYAIEGRLLEGNL